LKLAEEERPVRLFAIAFTPISLNMVIRSYCITMTSLLKIQINKFDVDWGKWSANRKIGLVPKPFDFIRLFYFV